MELLFAMAIFLIICGAIFGLLESSAKKLRQRITNVRILPGSKVGNRSNRAGL